MKMERACQDAALQAAEYTIADRKGVEIFHEGPKDRRGGPADKGDDGFNLEGRGTRWAIAQLWSVDGGRKTVQIRSSGAWSDWIHI